MSIFSPPRSRSDEIYKAFFSYFTVNCPLDLEFDDTRHDVFATKTGEHSCSGSLPIVHANKEEVGEF